jgi:hypothetical protein
MPPCALCGTSIERSVGESMVQFKRRIYCSHDCYNIVRSDLPRRLLNYVVDANGCHVWQGACNKAGYGQIKINGKQVGVHIVSYEFYVGPVPDGLTIDHTCENHPCMNPVHLEPVTLQVNILRTSTTMAAINAAKTHCPRNHPYSGDNLMHNKKGGRLCRICELERQRGVKRRQRERQRQAREP